MFQNYSVQIESFAERHFIKSFKKKYQNNWDMTRQSIILELERIDNFINTDKAETIYNKNNLKIVKTKFRIVGTKESATSSGNRCIVSVNENNRTVSILLVYGKTDLAASAYGYSINTNLKWNW